MRSAISEAKGWIRASARMFTKVVHRPMRFPTYRASVGGCIARLSDDTRYAALALALSRLDRQRIEGAIAELGVHQGITSRFIHLQSPHRMLYLFDTFEGFPDAALEVPEDRRFRDTSVDAVSQLLGNLENVEFRVGYFPLTAVGLEDQKFALVMMDFDLYQSSLDAFTFFYPRLAPGGYFFLHDYNNPESNHAVSRAATEFLRDKPELLVEIPDQWGSAVFRKLGPQASCPGQP